MSKKAAYEEKTCRYFRKPGPDNTSHVLKAVDERARMLGIRHVLVATCGGDTAFKAIEVFHPGIRLIAVTHVTGFDRPDTQEMEESRRRELQDRGVQVLTCQHAFGGVGRAVRNKLKSYQVDEIMAYTLRTFGQGTKVAIEIALMATDAGLVRTDEDIISVGGTCEGADTALVIKPANSFSFFDLKVREIICKPAHF
ncbi:MAG TPA: pyruvate kinase alpha/beta domain-containing protein [Syntrophales bacterium]|nr:pyruvate kinase alpha/beta domain-containing protein [Syntrophales bacterium]HOX95471.1 pyruvate kinase alpha/beta domain-containing protein [Syntrophales bacterium]HPI55789.1 pyruvate kinase alpha/beta domain-containing protein [Syntrophales bacterium]HPN23719.1 pyruvate kinase alpha/beta domain-containing protein [Syntrophales bacterium]HQM27755.1 pyruvate kinase alpha/beta domain-containing protein [Syntrophales bacterium]